MIDGTTVSENEYGLVRVFLAENQLAMDINHSGTLERLARALQINAINEKDVQTVQTDALGEMTLIDFLRAGYEVNEEDIATHQFALDAMGEMDALVIIMRSGAFPDRPATLMTTAEATLIATLREPDTSVTFEPLPNPSPEGVLQDPPQKKRPSDAAMSGRVAMIALLVMALLVWLMIWIAG